MIIEVSGTQHWVSDQLYVLVRHRVGQPLPRRETSPFWIKARMQNPSSFGSNSHLGSEKGLSTRVASMGLMVEGNGCGSPMDWSRIIAE